MQFTDYWKDNYNRFNSIQSVELIERVFSIRIVFHLSITSDNDFLLSHLPTPLEQEQEQEQEQDVCIRFVLSSMDELNTLKQSIQTHSQLITLIEKSLTSPTTPTKGKVPQKVPSLSQTTSGCKSSVIALHPVQPHQKSSIVIQSSHHPLVIPETQSLPVSPVKEISLAQPSISSSLPSTPSKTTPRDVLGSLHSTPQKLTLSQPSSTPLRPLKTEEHLLDGKEKEKEIVSEAKVTSQAIVGNEKEEGKVKKSISSSPTTATIAITTSSESKTVNERLASLSRRPKGFLTQLADEMEKRATNFHKHIQPTTTNNRNNSTSSTTTSKTSPKSVTSESTQSSKTANTTTNTKSTQKTQSTEVKRGRGRGRPSSKKLPQQAKHDEIMSEKQQTIQPSSTTSTTSTDHTTNFSSSLTNQATIPSPSTPVKPLRLKQTPPPSPHLQGRKQSTSVLSSHSHSHSHSTDFSDESEHESEHEHTDLTNQPKKKVNTKTKKETNSHNPRPTNQKPLPKPLPSSTSTKRSSSSSSSSNEMVTQTSGRKKTRLSSPPEANTKNNHTDENSFQSTNHEQSEETIIEESSEWETETANDIHTLIDKFKTILSTPKIRDIPVDTSIPANGSPLSNSSESDDEFGDPGLLALQQTLTSKKHIYITYALIECVYYDV